MHISAYVYYDFPCPPPLNSTQSITSQNKVQQKHHQQQKTIEINKLFRDLFVSWSFPIDFFAKCNVALQLSARFPSVCVCISLCILCMCSSWYRLLCYFSLATKVESFAIANTQSQTKTWNVTFTSEGFLFSVCGFCQRGNWIVSNIYWYRIEWRSSLMSIK